MSLRFVHYAAILYATILKVLQHLMNIIKVFRIQNRVSKTCIYSGIRTKGSYGQQGKSRF